MEGDINDLNRFRKNGDPTPEETKRIVDDIMAPYAKKHAVDKLADTDAAIQKSKHIHVSILREAQKETHDDVANLVPLDMDKWRKNLMEAYRVNFHRALTREEMVEVLAVMHTEISLGILK